MKNLLIFTFLVLSTLTFAQKKNLIDAVIIKNTNDTINSKILIYSNLFKKDLLDENSFISTTYLVDENGKSKGKIRAKEIKKLYFTDLNGENRIYVNNGKLLKVLFFDGKKIKWYRDLSRNFYDGTISYSDYLVDEKNKIYKIGFLNNIKKNLLEATKSKPELSKDIENYKTYGDILEI